LGCVVVVMMLLLVLFDETVVMVVVDGLVVDDAGFCTFNTPTWAIDSMFGKRQGGKEEKLRFVIKINR
jgi:hypothetical protein